MLFHNEMARRFSTYFKLCLQRQEWFDISNSPIMPDRAQWHRAFSPSKCVDTNTMISASASGFLLAPAWLQRRRKPSRARSVHLNPWRLPLSLLFLVYDGLHQFCLQAVFHVFVHPHMRRTVQIVECPGTQLIHVAVIVPQEAFHCLRITSAGLCKN